MPVTITFEPTEHNYRRRSSSVHAKQFTLENKDMVFHDIRGTCAAITVDGEPAIQMRIIGGGEMTLRIGDWLLTDESGLQYPCAAERFAENYVALDTTFQPGKSEE